MRQYMTKRRGFTLLELLVVLAIIGILVTLVASAVFRLRNSRDEVVTNETLEKIQGGFDLQRKAAMDLIRKEQPSPVALELAGLDVDLARTIHMKLRLRQEFPDKITELTAATLFPPSATGNAAIDTWVNTTTQSRLSGQTILQAMRTTYAPKSVYTQHLTALSALNASEQNGALLAIVLSVARGSAMFDAETAVGGAGTGNASGSSLKIFKDRWSRPIEWRRHSPTTGTGADPYLTNVLSELNDKPYTNTEKAKSVNHGYDALDPDNRLQRPNASSALLVMNFWLGNVNTGDNRQTIIFSQGVKAGVNGDELYGFRLKGTGKGS